MEKVLKNLAGVLGEIAQRSGGHFQEEAGCMLYAAAPSGPVLWNGVLRVRGSADANEILSIARAFFNPLSRGFTLHCLEPFHTDLVEQLSARGHEANATMPQMVLDAPVEPPELQPGCRIEKVENEAGRAHFLSVIGAAFETMGVEPSVWHEVYPDVSSLSDESVVTLVVYQGDQPAATGMCYLHSDVALLFNIGTHPDHRRRGLGNIVTRALTQEGFRRGAGLASLQSTSMGEELYKQVGYRELSRYSWYVYSPNGEDDA